MTLYFKLLNTETFERVTMTLEELLERISDEYSRKNTVSDIVEAVTNHTGYKIMGAFARR